MNPFLQKMGYGPEDKVLITHIDDIGFSHAANVASFECLDVGAATCGSILVAGPWFREAVERCHENERYDVGVHLTFTCEYDTFRWPAMSTRDPASGLLDDEGYLWRTREHAVRHVTSEAGAAEMRAQLDAALAAGLDVTHIDTHMGTVVHPRFLTSYLSLAQEYGIPAFLPAITRERLESLSQVDEPDAYEALIEQVEAAKLPTLDEIIIDTLLPMTDKSAFYRELIDGVQPGLTHLLFHPAKGGEELSAIDRRAAESRHADYVAFTDPTLKQYIIESGCKPLGYRELKAQMALG
ncbi:MAG: polysaccharide deacetylase family protein [Gammaproteobacteria bacterium]|nr:polysaccharide deacetylase family protein [Gammaproteobacteria bacterium]